MRAETERGNGVTGRAVATALVLLVMVAPAAFYVEIAWSRIYQFSSGVPAMAPVVLLLLLAGGASFPWLWRRGFSRRELLTVYSILLPAAPLVSHGVLFWMIPKTIAYYYMTQVHPLWETTFLPYVPLWSAPSDPYAIESFFEGRAQVPWSLWWGPLGAWGSFMLALFIATFCLMALVQHQWITNERLSFPIAQIPLEMVRDAPAGQGRAGRLSVSTMFWLGLGASFALNFMNTLSSKVPSIPAVPLGPVPIMQWQRVGPLAGLGEIDVVLWPGMIAIAYLIPKELSFSAWFFWLVRLGLSVAAIAAGLTPRLPENWYDSAFPAPYFQGGGAAFALALWVLWVARRHLARALRITLIPGRLAGTDSDEPLPYRWAFLGLAASLGWMVCFCWLAGCRVIFGLVLVGAIVGYYMMWARVRAETGLGFLPFPLEIQNAMVVPFGSGVFRPSEVVTSISTRWSYFPGFGESYEVCTGNVLEVFKVADAANINRRRLSAAILIGFVTTLVVGSYIILTGIYRYGYFGLAMGSAYGWPSWQTRNDGGRIFEYLTNPTKPDTNAVIAMAAGAVVAVTLGVMRLRFWWWPFHPVGYIAANCWGMQWYYMPFLVGWACKSLVIRYGGLRLYRATVPLAIGLIVGDLLNGGVWSAVALITRGRV